MFRTFAGALLFLAVTLGGCARDVTGSATVEPFPSQLTMAFRVRGEIDPTVWYYMVFNFTAAPSTEAAVNPMDFISDENRGRNWELYVMLHRNDQGTDELWTFQRPRLPTVLSTALKPTDCAPADFNGDSRTDIAVACSAGNSVQLIRSRQVDIYDPVFYDNAVEINTGTSPLRIFAGEFTGDANQDLLVIFKGAGAGGGFLRVLTGDGAGNFTAGTDLPLPAVPVDALVDDFNADSKKDLALLTTGTAAAEKNIVILTGDGAGNFTIGNSYAAGDDPVAIAAGQLDTSNLDLVVADGGVGATGGKARVYLGGGDGTFTVANVLAVSGRCTGVAVGLMYGSLDDIVVCYVDGTGAGQVGVFQNEAASPFQTPDVAVPVSGTPAYVLEMDTTGNGNGNALVVNGAPGSGGTNLFIRRGLRLPGAAPLDPKVFGWDPEPITYLTGLEPSRIRVGDLDSDGKQDDLLIPNSANDPDNGNSINLFFGLGRDNFTNADVFWTDDLPEPLTTKDWYISHTVGPNFFELTIDPGLFYDLAQRPPVVGNGFNVTFMTGTSGIDLVSNLNQQGQIKDVLLRPVNVPMEVGHYDDEQNTPLATNPVPIAAEDIDSWRVEVS